VALLTHELGHHQLGHNQNENDEMLLDNLAVKVEAMLMTHSQRVEQGVMAPRWFVQVINFQRWDVEAKLFVTDGENMENLSQLARSYVDCPRGTQVAGFKVDNLHWQQLPKRISQSPDLWKIEVRGLVTGSCKAGGALSSMAPQVPMAISLILSEDATGKKSYVQQSAVAGQGRWD
jgi:hypothetical protein